MLAGAEEVKLSVVPVSFSYTSQETVSVSEKFYNAKVYINDIKQSENSDYIITGNGTQILFKSAPDPTATKTISYANAITLQEINKAALIPEPLNNRLYTVPNSGTIYGYYKLLNSIEFKKDSAE